jgi:hypothetical protein
MRKLIREMDYERPVAAGRYRYTRHGKATGAVESWRLTAARDGYHFLRVDLNAQEAACGNSYLYHLTLDAAGRPERLSFRFFGPGQQIGGNVLFSAGVVTAVRTVNGERVEEEMVLPAAYAFWFPATAGLSLLAQLPAAARVPAVTLCRDRHLALAATNVMATMAALEQIELMGQVVDTRRLTVQWDGQERTLWLDEYGWPLRMQRNDLVATETRYLRYKQGGF